MSSLLWLEARAFSPQIFQELLKDLQDIVHLLKARGVTLRATEQPINTQSATGKAFLDMLNCTVLSSGARPFGTFVCRSTNARPG